MKSFGLVSNLGAGTGDDIVEVGYGAGSSTSSTPDHADSNAELIRESLHSSPYRWRKVLEAAPPPASTPPTAVAAPLVAQEDPNSPDLPSTNSLQHQVVA